MDASSHIRQSDAQLSLVRDPDLARRKRDAAIARAYNGAEEEWRIAAAWAIYTVALTKRVFTGDDVWATGLPKPREARALGPIMLRAKRAGVIRRTGRVVPSDVPENHRNPHYEWESLIFGRPFEDRRDTMFPVGVN